MLRCMDNSIYTGIAKDLEKRINQHLTVDEKCAKYTKSHIAQKLEIAFVTETKKDACKLEYYIKRLSKCEKEEMISKRKISEKLLGKIDFEKYNLI
ncbi:MAG: GIY-YIG nuclease family protein [Clostridia bacterium]|nr:GIY-YIG nuclease family protein [Clostridia bacterium]